MASEASTDETEATPPFVLRELNPYLLEDNDETKSKQHKEKYRHLNKRDYSCGAVFLHNPIGSLEDFDKADEADSDSPESSESPDDESEEDEWPGFGELIELSDDECVSHYNRILKGDFPWKEFNKLVLKANESGEMEHTDLAEWQHLHGLHLQFSKPKVAHAGNIERIRCRVNDILLWALALDRRYDVPETVKIIASFKRPWLTLFIEFEDVLVDTKVVNGKRLKLL